MRGVEARSDGGAADCKLHELGPCGLYGRAALAYLCCIAGELLSECKRRGILQMRSAN